MLIASSEFVVTSVSFHKEPLDSVSESLIMNPFLVRNRQNTIGWRWCMGHPSKIHHPMHQWKRETLCALRRTPTRTYFMTWLRGDPQQEYCISSTKLLSTPFPNDKTKWSRQHTARNSWMLDKQSSRLSTYDTHSVCLVCLLKDHLGYSGIIKPLSRVPRSHIRC